MTTPELDNCQFRRTHLIARSVNPIFHHHSLISHYPLTLSMSLLYESSTFNKEYHCNKNGAKRSSIWPDTPFWPISIKEIQQKGCQKGWKTNFHQIRFPACQTIPIIKEVLQSCFEMKRGPGPWVECGGSIRKHSVPRFELDFCPEKKKNRLRW